MITILHIPILRLSLAYFPGVHAGPMSLVSVCSAIYELVSNVDVTLQLSAGPLVERLRETMALPIVSSLQH